LQTGVVLFQVISHVSIAS